jgi:hypothetical protein
MAEAPSHATPTEIIEATSSDDTRKVFNVFFHEFVGILCTTFPDNAAFPMLKDVVSGMIKEQPASDLLYSQFRSSILPFVGRIKERDEKLIINGDIPELAALDIHTVWSTLEEHNKNKLWKELQRLAEIVQRDSTPMEAAP